MAGTAHRGTRGRGRSPRAASSSPSRAAAPAPARGSSASGNRSARSIPRHQDPAQLEAQDLVTRSTYRVLLFRGLAPEEAANLTAFLCGIPIAQVRWSLRQINQLLFLRELARTGRFGASDGGPPRPH